MKKHLFLQRQALPLSILGAALPLSLFLAGCGGGSGGNALTPNPTPTTPPTTTGYKLSGDVTYSNVSAGSSVVATRLVSLNTFNEPSVLSNIQLAGKTTQSVLLGGKTGSTTGGGTLRVLTVNLSASTDTLGTPTLFSVGQSIPLNESNQYLQLTQFTGEGPSETAESWRTASGEAIIRAIGTKSITIELRNARFTPTNLNGGTGSFTLNGTLTGSGLEVFNG